MTHESTTRSPRIEQLLGEHLQAVARRTDRLFSWLLLAEYVGGLVLAAVVSPYTWAGIDRRIHPHVVAALVLGALASIVPAWCARFRPGRVATRHVVAIGQMAMTALFIHLSGGRIETHFMVFGSLAFVAFYRDYRVLLTASAVVVVDHLARGAFWPESVYGVVSASLWRAVEHGVWVVFEDVFLLASCLQGQREMRWISERHAQLEEQRDRIAATEEALRRSNEDLDRRVGERTEELRHAKEAAEDASRAKSEFLANMSHEVRTPMAAVQGYAELILDERLTAEGRRSHVKTILRSGQHLMSILDNILDLSKIEAGKMSVEEIECSPARILHEVASLMQVRAREKRLAFEIRYTTPVPALIRSDPTRLRQILLNLVGNAIKFTASGMVRILVRCEAPASADPRLSIEVADTGPGLTPEQVSTLFQPFVQADTSTTRRFGGTGLGLTICRRLSEMLGGSLAVESAPGRGSSFMLDLGTGPLAGVTMLERFDEHETAAPSSRRPLIQLSGSILLAEDFAPNQLLLSTHLENAGAAVTVADNGRSVVDLALAAARSPRPFDLIFMDMQMPELDGYQATSELRRAGYTGPIVALTAHAMSSDRDKCLSAGCTDFLTKPVRRDDLVAMAARHLRGAALPPLYSELSRNPKLAGIVRRFVGDLPNQARAIEEAARRADLAGIRHLAHQVKGTAGGFGFQPITDAAAVLERAAAESAEPEAIRGHVEALVALCARAMAAPLQEVG